MLSRGQRNLKLSQSTRDPSTFLAPSRVEEVEVGASREALWPAWGLDQIPGFILLAPHGLNAEVIPGGAPPPPHTHTLLLCVLETAKEQMPLACLVCTLQCQPWV